MGTRSDKRTIFNLSRLRWVSIILTVIITSSFFALPVSASWWNPVVTSSTTYNGVKDASVVYGPNCDVTDATFLGNGGAADWSINNRLVYTALDSGNHSQVYTSNPDGSNVNCLTCSNIPDGPRANRNKFNPMWDPTGQYIVMQVELPNDPLSWLNTYPTYQELQLNGLWTDMWVSSADGSQWSKLTSTLTTRSDGVLMPVFSHDRSMVMWSRLMKSADSTAQFGTWQLQLANFSIAGGVAKLSNVRDITPPGGLFYESHGFSVDGSSVYFTSDIGHPGTWVQNIWSMNLQTGALTNLTNNGYWNEHASVAPGGQKLSYMSSEPYPWNFLKTDLLIMDTSGGSKAMVTHFGVPGYVESLSYQVVVERAHWNSDGTRVAITLQRADTYPTRELWILTFAGQCGT